MFNYSKFVSATLIIIAGLFGLTIIFGSWYTVDERERAVFLRNGRLIAVVTPGLGFKWPIIDSVIKISLETQIAKFSNLHTYSGDQQPATISLSVNFRATHDKVDDLYTQFGSLKGFEDRIIAPKVLEELKSVFGRFNAVTSIQDRARLNTEVREAIIKAARGPVIIENIQIENIDFSKEYERSIEQRMLAEVEVQRIRQNAEREKINAEIVVIQANAKAAAVRAAAQAEAEAIKLRGEAEALAIRARAEALGQNPHLVTLVQAERWNGVLPSTILPNTAVPLLNTGR